MATDEAGPSSRTVWIRGPGLNSVTQPNRAEEFLGENWENMTIEVTVLKMRAGGHMHVQLSDGYKCWVAPEFIAQSTTVGEESQEDEEEAQEVEADLGSDIELEDVLPEDEGVIEGSEPLAYNITRDRNWNPVWVLQDQRTKEEHTRVHKGKARGMDHVDKDSIFAYFWAMLPVQEVDEGIALMQQKGRLQHSESEVRA